MKVTSPSSFTRICRSCGIEHEKFLKRHGCSGDNGNLRAAAADHGRLAARRHGNAPDADARQPFAMLRDPHCGTCTRHLNGLIELAEGDSSRALDAHFTSWRGLYHNRLTIRDAYLVTGATLWRLKVQTSANWRSSPPRPRMRCCRCSNHPPAIALANPHRA